jgi:ATP adenylyltransferase
MTLISAPKRKGCIFCRVPRGANARRGLLLAVTRSTIVMLNKFPYNSGHLMVAPRRHVAELEHLTAAERRAVGDTLHRVAAIVRREFRPQGMNLGMNLGAAAGAGIADHLHWHVVPRWNGDTNFMPALGSVKVMPEHLLETYDRLHAHFAPRARRAPKRR